MSSLLPPSHRPSLAAAQALLLLALAACGGGGDATGPAPAPAPANNVPTAALRAPASIAVGERVQLDGRESRDRDGDPLTYHWAFTSRPQGSRAGLSGVNAAVAAVVADVPGRYVVTLIVGDGKALSTPVSMTLSASEGNAAPMADAGPDQQVVTGLRVRLDGTASVDPNGDPLSYAWVLASRPAGSAAALQGADTATPGFMADVAGDYVALLTVGDGRLQSEPARVTVRVDAPALAVVATPSQADFGTVPVGMSSVRIFTLRNTGNGPLSFKAGHPATDGGVWSLGARSCTGVLAPAASCTVAVVFTPRSAQAYTGTVAFLFDELEAEGGGPRPQLAGSGSGEVSLGASASPALWDFGGVPVGTQAQRVFTLSNTGNRTLTFTAGYPATDGDVWSIGGRSCTGQLAAGASCTVTVTFAPTGERAYAGNVYFYFNELQVGQGNPIAGVTGTGHPPRPGGAEAAR